MRRLLLFLVPLAALQAEQPYCDRTHKSRVFGEPRHYRIFLPLDYEISGKHYPVIYYFHGHSDRYTLELYDHGLDTIPKISAFVANHEAIVVAVDGYVARDYTSFYNGTPYDVRHEGGDIDFGAYFLELVRHIDSTWRTIGSRRYRATSGLNWRRAKVHTSSPWLTEIADIQEDKQREWTSAQSRTSLIGLWSRVPPGTEIPVILDCESWGFYFIPDVRYGKEPLYQAFQFHKHHLFSWKWTHP